MMECEDAEGRPNYVIELFEIGKHKIKFSKSFSDTKYIEVLDINFYKETRIYL